MSADANRQNVQRVVNDLARDELVKFAANPHHKRAQLVVLTDKGRKAFEKAMSLYDPGANAISSDISIAEIKIALKVMNAIRGKLEGGNENGD